MRIIRRYYSIISPLSISSNDTGVFPAVQYPSASKKPVSHQRLQSGGSLRSQSSLRLTASSTGSSSASEPPCLLQKVRMIRVIRLHKLTVPNGLMKCGEVMEIKVEKGRLSRLVLRKRKLRRVERFPVLAAAVIAPPVVPVMNMQIFF